MRSGRSRLPAPGFLFPDSVANSHIVLLTTKKEAALLRYLEALASAAVHRDPREIARLLAHPLARRLPRRVRQEALAIARRGPSGWIAPVQTLRLLQRLRQLEAAGEGSAGGYPQLELPLRAAG